MVSALGVSMYVESVVLRRKRKPSIIQTQLTRTQYIISYTSLPGNIFWEVQVGFGKQEALEACQTLLALAFSALCNPTCEPSLMQRRCEPSIGLLQAAYIRSLVVRGCVLSCFLNPGASCLHSLPECTCPSHHSSKGKQLTSIAV